MSDEKSFAYLRSAELRSGAQTLAQAHGHVQEKRLVANAELEVDDESVDDGGEKAEDRGHVTAKKRRRYLVGKRCEIRGDMRHVLSIIDEIRTRTLIL